MSGSSYVGKTACEGKKFYVEVTGVQHGKEQAIQFYDLTDMTEQEALENKQEVDEKEETSVFSWDWCDETENRNVWLSIPTEDQPIKLPLFENVTSYNLRNGDQDYMLQAVVPMTLMPTFNGQLKDEDRAAPLRYGYFYIAYNGKIWRELLISPSSSGSPSFKDVNLSKYRKGKGQPFKEKVKREVSGVELTNIWYPAKKKGNETDIRIAYSEVPWSAARLNRLEKYPDELKERMTSVSSTLSIIRDKDKGSERKTPKMRTRDELIELQLAEPVVFNRDLTGNIIKSRLESANKEREEYCKYDEFTKHGEIKYEYPARSAVLGHRLWEIQKEAKIKELGKEPDLSLWSAGSSADYLELARKQKLRTVIVSDPIFKLRHQNAILLSAQGFLQQIQLDAMSQPFYKSAELLQAFVLSPTLGEQENTAHKFKNDVNCKPHSTFNKTLRTYWRDCIRHDIRNLQRYVTKCLDDNEFAIALKDIISLDDANALGAYILVNTCRNALQSDAEEADKFVLKHERRSFVSTLVAVNKIFSDDSSLELKRVLFGEDNTKKSLQDMLAKVEATADYKKALAESENVNDGSGIINISRLADLVDQGLELSSESINQQEAGALIRISEDADQDKFPQVRRIVNTIDSVLSSYFQGAIALSKALRDSKLTTTIKFNKLYVEALSISKMLGGDTLRTLKFEPVTGSKIEGYVIGVESAKVNYGTKDSGGSYKSASNRSVAHGDIEVEKNKWASTAKARMKGIDFAEEHDLKLVVLTDKNCDAAKYLENNHQALSEIKSNKLSRSNAYEKFNVPAFILMVELQNCWNALSYLYKHHNDLGYSIINLFSAGTDIGLAAIHCRNLFKANTGRLFTYSDMSIKEFSAETVAKWPEGKLNVKLVGRITYLETLGCAAGLLTAGLMAWDVVRLFANNDKDAAFGTSLMCAGTIFGSVAGLFFDATWTFMGMGPVGWFSFILILAGFGITYWFTDGPLESWIKNGPFGLDPASGDDDYAFLSERPEEAYKQLISLFVLLRLKVGTIENLPLTKDNKANYISSGITHFVQVKTNVSQLLNIKDKKIIFNTKFREVLERASENQEEIEARERMKRTFGKNAAKKYRSPQWQVVKYQDINPSDVIYNEQGAIYLFRNSIKSQKTEVNYPITTIYQRNVQALVQLDVRQLSFPQPPMDKFNKSDSDLKSGKISLENARFSDGQTVGFLEKIFNTPKTHPINYYWLDSRRKECLESEV